MMPAETVDPSQLQAARALMTLAENDCTQQPDDKVEEIPTEVELTKCFLDITVPTAPMSPYHLVYEALAQEPWKVLIGSLLMKRVNTVTGRCMVLDFFKKFPTLESIKTVHLVDFFMEVRSVPMLSVLAKDTEAIALSLLARVPNLEDVPHITAYSCKVFRIFCLQQFCEKDIKDLEQSYDLRTYVRWRLANQQ